MNSKKIILTAILVVILVMVLVTTRHLLFHQGLFNRSWSIVYCDSEGEGIEAFTLHLSQKENKIIGKHTRVASFGNRIDYGEESIEGVVKDSIAMITIRSGRISNKALATGKAKLELLKNDSLKFVLLEEPKEWEHNLPDSINLPLYLLPNSKKEAKSILGIEQRVVNIEKTNQENVHKVYVERFWVPNRIDEIKNIDLKHLIFDGIVNLGSNTAIEMVQNSINENFNKDIEINGLMNSETIEIINSVDPIELYNEYINDRSEFYYRLVEENLKYNVFIDGWQNRVDKFHNKITHSDELF